MKSCYVVMRNVYRNVNDERNVESCVYALTENLYLAEKVIANYFVNPYGEKGDYLVCEVRPGDSCRKYWMRSQYKEEKGATYFTVFEEEIKDDMALL